MPNWRTYQNPADPGDAYRYCQDCGGEDCTCPDPCKHCGGPIYLEPPDDLRPFNGTRICQRSGDGLESDCDKAP